MGSQLGEEVRTELGVPEHTPVLPLGRTGRAELHKGPGSAAQLQPAAQSQRRGLGTAFTVAWALAPPPSSTSRHGADSSEDGGAGSERTSAPPQRARLGFNGERCSFKTNRQQKGRLRLSEFIKKKQLIKNKTNQQSCSQSHTQRNQPTPTCARNGKMTIYIYIYKINQ